MAAGLGDAGTETAPTQPASPPELEMVQDYNETLQRIFTDEDCQLPRECLEFGSALYPLVSMSRYLRPRSPRGALRQKNNDHTSTIEY